MRRIDERVREQIREPTAKVKDDDIIDLFKKYPVKPSETLDS